jgi:flagellar basal-body rod protein FlgB
MADGALNITGYLESAIKAEGMRQKAIASNVANSQTPGYRRIDVRFADIVAEAMERGDDSEAGELEGELIQPLNTPVDGSGNDVDLDTEMGQLVKNSLLQKTYMRLLARKYRQIETAMNTGAG